MADLKKTVGIFLPALRISLALVLLTASLLLIAELLGFTPNEAKFLLEARRKVSESLAIQFSVFAPDQDAKDIEKMIAHVVKRNPEIESAGFRLLSGKLLFKIGDHENKWGALGKDAKAKSTATHLVVPILQQNQPWANIELKFTPLRGESAFDFFKQSIFKMSGFILLVGFFVYLAFMLRTLRLLDPSAVIPDRVNAAFDTMTEGIIILDENEQIILANKAFTKKIALPIASLLGIKLSSLKWKSTENADVLNEDLPWQKVLRTGKSFIGTQLILAADDNNTTKFVINASPIRSKGAYTEGVIISLDDVTELEERNTALQTLVNRLEETQAFVEQQNKELNYLATRDPLSGCFNRRSFNEHYEKAFKEARQFNTSLSFIMTDIDYFKKVNDNYGHATGDTVIKMFADILQSNIRKVDLLGRYGGEEFSIALPGLTADEAFLVAERIRLRIKNESAQRFENGPHVTASFGIASLNDKPGYPDELQKFADEALYVAKESGRNRVVQWRPRTDAERPDETVAATHTAEKYDAWAKPDSDKVIKLQQRVIELESIASQFSAELEYTKHYDKLTGLPNQVLFYDRIGQVIERGNRFDQMAAVFVIDVGEVNQINTTFGRIVGDKLITEVAERLRNTFRKYDAISRLTISRFGGDEFAVLLTDLASKETVTWIVMRMQDILAQVFDIDGNSIFITSHVGVSLYPSEANNVDDLIKNAMLAKKYSKQSHTESHYQFFDEKMQSVSSKHVTLDKELRDAVYYESWILLYQPRMDIKSKVILGAEALIRWKHPTRGVLSPFEFIEFAEQRGLIVAIGDWVIKTACQQIQEWMSQGIDCKVSVNVSAMQLKQGDFVDKVFRTLTAYGVPPRQLEIEVTESTLMNNFEVALQSLKRLNSRGITIAIDDFGTGYSSLGYLKNLPINTLKIDRIFIKDLCNDENDKQIVKALISMAHAMNMAVVAEGVEEKNQFDLLADYDCDEIQGYLLSKPIPDNELTAMLSKAEYSVAF